MMLRRLGQSDIWISPVALGCWPIAGITSIDVTQDHGLATIEACFDVGVNFLDTAYCYGYDGESERMIGRVVRGRRDQVVIATKCGIEWGPDRKQIIDGRPATLRRQFEASLVRLATDRVELLYLHAPDPNTPIEESAGELLRFVQEGKTRTVGVSNVSLTQLEAFAAVCPIAAYQPAYNMLQRQIERDTLPWCERHGVSSAVYWPLMKGLLAGRLPRDHQFDPKDGRQKYPMYHGDEWQKNQDFVDELRAVAADAGKTVSQLVINWTIHRPSITSALCGAKRPEQIRENAGAMGWQLTPDQLLRIDRAIARRGEPLTRSPV